MEAYLTVNEMGRVRTPWLVPKLYTRVSPLATNEEKGNWITWEFESLRECQNKS